VDKNRHCEHGHRACRCKEGHGIPNGHTLARIPIVDGKRRCRTCKILKDIGEFYARSGRNSPMGECKSCANARTTENARKRVSPARARKVRIRPKSTYLISLADCPRPGIFYTYLWLRSDGTPYYVGKGTRKRAYETGDHGVKCPKELSRILVQEFPSELDAFETERFFISYYGRKDLGTGCLRNRTEGGEGVSGLKFSAESRKKLSESHKRLVRSPEHCRNIGLAHMGKVRSAETRQKQSEAAKRRVLRDGMGHLSAAGKRGAASRWSHQ
jgi:hypothetical protein